MLVLQGGRSCSGTACSAVTASSASGTPPDLDPNIHPAAPCVRGVRRVGRPGYPLIACTTLTSSSASLSNACVHPALIAATTLVGVRAPDGSVPCSERYRSP